MNGGMQIIRWHSIHFSCLFLVWFVRLSRGCLITFERREENRPLSYSSGMMRVEIMQRSNNLHRSIRWILNINKKTRNSSPVLFLFIYFFFTCRPAKSVNGLLIIKYSSLYKNTWLRERFLCLGFLFFLIKKNQFFLVNWKVWKQQQWNGFTQSEKKKKNVPNRLLSFPSLRCVLTVKWTIEMN